MKIRCLLFSPLRHLLLPSFLYFSLLAAAIFRQFAAMMPRHELMMLAAYAMPPF